MYRTHDTGPAAQGHPRACDGTAERAPSLPHADRWSNIRTGSSRPMPRVGRNN